MGTPQEIMMKSMNQMLKSLTGIEFTDDFMELVQKIKIKEFSTNPDKELLTLYGQIEVENEESLEALEKLIAPMLAMIKQFGAEKDATQET